MFRLFVAGKAGWGFYFMELTTTFKVKNRDEENGFELEYFHFPEIYQLRILELKNNKWQTKNSFEFERSKAADLLHFIQLTLEKPNK